MTFGVFMAKLSPFDSVHKQLGARFGEFDGWTLPADFGDTAVETEALRTHCAVVDLSSFGRLSLKGAGAAAFAGGLLEHGKMFDGQWKWATLGKAGMNLPCRMGRINGEVFVFTPPGTAEGATEALGHMAGEKGADVSVTNVTDKTAMLGLYGPGAIASVKDVLPFDISDLERGDIRRMSFFMISFTLMRGSWVTHGDGLELICPATAGPLAAGAIAKYRHKKHLTPAGMNSLMTAMTQ
jgi:aminomethyltransferase